MITYRAGHNGDTSKFTKFDLEGRRLARLDPRVSGLRPLLVSWLHGCT